MGERSLLLVHSRAAPSPWSPNKLDAIAGGCPTVVLLPLPPVGCQAHTGTWSSGSATVAFPSAGTMCPEWNMREQLPEVL